jgi:aminoglycoside phosphotransferase (APT) family kinase protein
VTDSHEAEVLATLEAHGVLAADGPPPRLSRLGGGWWNDVWRLRSAGRDWVVKLFVDEGASTLFPMLPDDEARVLEVLRGRRIAPEPVAYVPRAEGRRALLVYEFHPGGPWLRGVAAVADLMRRQHALAPDGLRTVPVAPDAIVDEGDVLLDDVADTDAVAALRAHRPRPAALRPRPLALLHTDAGPANLITGGDGIRLIDWQCPALGDAAEDLFSFSAPAFQLLSDRPPLTPGQRRRFLRAYGDTPVLRRLEELWPALSYRMAAYCCRRAIELADTHPAGSARYRRALALTLDEIGER